MKRTEIKRVAVLGTGAMGSRMARRLLKAGLDVRVYNRDPSKIGALIAAGAKQAKTPAEATRECDVAFGMVTHDEASRSIWLSPETGGIHAMQPGSIAVESSTLTPGWVKELGDVMAQQKVAFLDAPVAGSRPQAEAGQLIYLVGGAAETFARVKDLLSLMGGALHHVGPVGTGSTMKLAVNALFGIQVAALAEVIGLTTRAGMTTEDTVSVLSQLPITSPALKGVGAAFAARAFQPMFPIDLVEKDFRYVVETAEKVGATATIAASVRRLYQDAQNAGHGGDNITGVLKVMTD